MVRVNSPCGERIFAAGGVLSRTDFGQSKVENLGVATFRNKNVRWLDVSMDDALQVRSVQPISYADRHIEQSSQFHRAASDGVFKGPSFQKLHGDKGRTVFLADVVNCTDIRMI